MLNTSTSGLGGPESFIFCSGLSPFRYAPTSLVRYEQMSGEKPRALARGIRSVAIREVPSMAVNRQEEAYETLSTAAARFPSAEIILYDLACACCSLKQFDEARGWLRKAIEEGGNEIKLRALDDPDLEPLWKDIGST